MRAPRSTVLETIGCHLLLLVSACGADPRSSVLPTPDGTPALCSQMHRDVSRWQGTEIADCGPDVSGLVELTPLGNDQLLVRKRFSSRDELWRLTPEGALLAAPTTVNQIAGAATAGFTWLPGPPNRILVYDPRQSYWSLYETRDASTTHDALIMTGSGQWPTGFWPANPDGGPWNHQFIGVEGGNILDRDLADGSLRLWSVRSGPVDSATPLQLVGSASLVAGPEEHFRRGHRLIHLGPNRLLEWLPRPGEADGGGSDFALWSYSLNDAAGLDPRIVSTGRWADVGNESDIVADAHHLFVWTRATGRLRAFAIDPTLLDPLSQSPVADSGPNARLASQVWKPPTRSPAIEHLVLILQEGRSFDSYFGRACQGTSVGGEALTCTRGMACCEAMPPTVPGAAGCVDLEDGAAYRPVDAPRCMRTKMNGGSMDGFATGHPPDACGDPRDFACDRSGAAASYQGMAEEGALADRFFQTYAFVAAGAGGAEPEAMLQNLLYLVSARFAGFPPALIDTPLLTKELVRLQVPWTLYAGPANLALMRAFGVPIYYDPDWFPYRSLNDGELEHDLAVGALPAVSVVVPDRADPLRSESPGHPLAPGIAFTRSIVDAIASSPYQNNTLVLVTHLTAGGFYDHVPPPPPPPRLVDASSGSATSSAAIHYGPRVPLLALGKFARRNVVSHVQLEISSVTKFVEWNWLRGSVLKGIRQTDDHRSYRDTAVNNLGSLIDGAAAEVEVPSGPD